MLKHSDSNDSSNKYKKYYSNTYNHGQACKNKIRGHHEKN